MSASAYGDDNDDRDRQQAMIDWLSDKSPDLWFEVAQHLNWDNSMRVLDWIVSQPQCDKANAAAVFWGCDPTYYMRNPSRDLATSDGFNLLQKIQRNWQAGFYQRAELAWNEDWRTQYRNTVEKLPGQTDPLAIPDDLLGPIRGRAPNVPKDLRAYNNAELRRLFWDLGTDIGLAPDSPEAKKIERRLQRDAIWRIYWDIFRFCGRAALWMMPLGFLVIAGAFVLRWWTKGVMY